MVAPSQIWPSSRCNGTPESGNHQAPSHWTESVEIITDRKEPHAEIRHVNTQKYKNLSCSAKQHQAGSSAWVTAKLW